MEELNRMKKGERRKKKFPTEKPHETLSTELLNLLCCFGFEKVSATII